MSDTDGPLPAAILGSFDGLLVALSLVIAFAYSHPMLLVRGALVTGSAEAVAMTAGEFLAENDSNMRTAGVMGAATLLACAVPALPFLLWTGGVAVSGFVLLAVALCVLITWARTTVGRSWARAAVETLAVAVVAATLTFAATLVPLR